MSMAPAAVQVPLQLLHALLRLSSFAPPPASAAPLAFVAPPAFACPCLASSSLLLHAPPASAEHHGAAELTGVI